MTPTTKGREAVPPSPILALSQRLRSGAAVLSAWVSQDPHAASTLGRLGFDAVSFDLQHSRLDLADAVLGIALASAAGQPSVVRIPVGEFQTASRVLDAGAAGVIAPMINSADEARALVRFCKYPPQGERSFGAYAALAMSGLDRKVYLGEANRFVQVFAMIETREALAALDEILAVEGLDGVFVGPADLSIGLSDGQAIDPDSAAVQAALARVAHSAQAAGKVAGAYALTGEWAARAARAGLRFLAVGSDTLFMAAGAQHALAAARAGA
ncbi:aldolase/citrate lyase family protein [Hydrogenophaga sp.]|uniref:HpcH/HpaI aldolase family protein n=1 Tax=Hydrogenophaga sp. TaxID=1904254 RepID=UPI002614EDEE|nr:aldolase/citrate lyase family protein [Hydrogenophaga sp.]MCW5653215.1 2,4-dihydroxyhept-2-ene-1,7-dioic acid aldolase [Hydrogenophaga sp.]